MIDEEKIIGYIKYLNKSMDESLADMKAKDPDRDFDIAESIFELFKILNINFIDKINSGRFDHEF